jgi:hypothetical protein
MAELHVGRLVVVSPEDSDKMIGIVTRSDLLKSRARTAEEERKRERFLGTCLVPTNKQQKEGLRQKKAKGETQTPPKGS